MSVIEAQIGFSLAHTSSSVSACGSESFAPSKITDLKAWITWSKSKKTISFQGGGDAPPSVAEQAVPRKPQKTQAKQVTIDGTIYRQVNVHRTKYRVTKHERKSRKNKSLADRGSNGGVGGKNVRVINLTGRKVDIEGIDDHSTHDQ